MTATLLHGEVEDCYEVQTYRGQKKRHGEPVFPDKPLKAALEYIDRFILNTFYL